MVASVGPASTSGAVEAGAAEGAAEALGAAADDDDGDGDVAADGGTGTTGDPSGVGVPGSAATAGSEPATKVASCIFPRGANARFNAGVGLGAPPPGGPPQTPRRGFLHAMGPFHA